MRKYYRPAALRLSCLVTILGATFLAPQPLAAQQAERLARLVGLGSVFDFSAETRLGAVTPRRADTGFEGTFEWNVGSLGQRWLRPIFGVDVFHADLPRGVGDITNVGSITSAGVLAGFRAAAMVDAMVSPYFIGGLTGSYQWANASDKATELDLRGTRFGVALGGGAAGWLRASPFALTGDVRHVFAGDMSRSTYTVGVRVQPRMDQMRRHLDEQAERVKDAINEVLRLREAARDAQH